MTNDTFIGIQLYTVRNALATDLQGTLTKLAAIGYNSVEAAGYAKGKFYGQKPLVFKTLLDDHGMKAHGSHVVVPARRIKKVVEDTIAAGIDYLVYPWVDEKDRTCLDDWKRLAEHLSKIGEACRDAGIGFAYHNHDFELIEIEGHKPYDLLLNNTDPTLVKMEIDFYFFAYIGLDPLPYLNAYPGRFDLWHIKDMDERKNTVAVGTGTIDFAGLLTRAKQAGMKYCFVEQDTCTGDIFTHLTTSYHSLNTMLSHIL